MDRLMKEKFYRGIQFLFLLVLCFLGGNLFVKTSQMVASSEGKQIVAASFLENIESLAQGALNEMLPIIGMELNNTEKQNDFGMNEFTDFITNEILPVLQYETDYGKSGEQLLTYQEEIPVYFYEDDETTEEVSVEVATKDEKNKKEQEITKTKPSKGKTYTKAQLYDPTFLRDNFYIVDSTTTITSKELDGKKLLSKDMSIKMDGDKPKVLIYHTHGSETFKDSRAGKTEDTIIGVGDTLTTLLEDKYNIPVYHDKTIYDTINGKLDRSRAYTYSSNGIEKILKKYPSIEVVIDLHRDGVAETTHLVTNINGKACSQIMFFNGVSRTAKNGDIGYLANPNKEGNLAFSLQLQLAAQKRFPDFTRRIYIKGYRYNLQFKPRSLLVEAGAQTNTVQEVKNAMEPLAQILNDVLVK